MNRWERQQRQERLKKRERLSAALTALLAIKSDDFRKTDEESCIRRAENVLAGQLARVDALLAQPSTLKHKK